jgi:hypothetical protein
MNLRLLTLALAAAVAVSGLRAADEPESKLTPREALRARMAEEAKKKSATAPKPAPAASAQPAAAPAPTSPPAKDQPDATPAATKPAKEAATMLPKVEVKKERITVLDVEIAKQEEAIARERKNLKPSEADLALNDSAIAKPMAIFGGESAQFRKRVASERVELMEAEKDILEAMKRARTKEEKAELQKQVDELRAVRRELEKTLR